ncbi:rna sigma-24 ecf subfamily : [Tuwongella immobilis]|uniref:Rna sigma-24 ecf subfamily n=1 Tax=Tuwongella immobilis TaxID=692036 RepID=A0A6C2YKT5_9BACT|nr:rna sigma-24 ecf subfamily : [Tuwongella immobilis]VTR99257.1 rna sigma-24 ecf subfamily : [Tuwongella immobilis]
MDSTEIEPIIERIAWLVSRRGQRQDREDFAQELYLHLHQPRANGSRISKCDPKRPLEPFIYRIAERLWSRQRRRNGMHSLHQTDGVPIEPADHRGRNDRLFLALHRLGVEPFSETDLEILATWQLDRRVILLAVTHLHHKYPPQWWQRDVLQLGSRRNLVIPMPFPPVECLPDQGSRSRYNRIAELLQTTPNNLAQVFKRNRQLLQQLECVQHAFRMLDWENENDQSGSIR